MSQKVIGGGSGWPGSSAILRGVSGRLLQCGCLAGTYELYDGRLVSLIDGRGPNCPDERHREGVALGEGSRPEA